MEKKKKETLSFENGASESQPGENFLSAEKRKERKTKKRQKLGTSEADIEHANTGAGPDVSSVVDRIEKENRKKKQKFETCEAAGEGPDVAATVDKRENEKKRKKKKLESCEAGSGTLAGCFMLAEKEENTKQKYESSSVDLSREDNHSPVEGKVVSSSISPLELLKLIRDREVSPDRKLKLAFDFVRTHEQLSTFSGQAGLFSEKGLMSPSHFITTLSEWSQTQITSASKTYSARPATGGRRKGIETSSGGQRMSPSHLDERYWTVLRWCLLSGIEWKAAVISLSIMQAVSCILDEASIVLSGDRTLLSNAEQTDLDKGKWGFTTAFFLVLLDVGKLLFHVYEGSFRPKLDLWISCTRSSLKLASILCTCTDVGDFSTEGVRALYQFLSVLCRGFVRFVRSSPNPRKVFQAVVEKLLESLLTLLAGLKVEESGSHVAEMNDLSVVIEEILKYSLFHPFHIEGYTNVCKVLKQAGEFCNDAIKKETKELCNNGKVTSVMPTLLSYHKMLFQQLRHFLDEGKVSTLGSYAWMLRAYIHEFKGQAVSRFSTSLGVKSKHALKNSSKKTVDVENLGLDSGLDKSQGRTDSERSGLFAMFAELLFPLLKQFEVLASFCLPGNKFDILTLCKAKSVLTAANGLLVVAIEEQVYVPTEDTPSLSHLSFMKNSYNMFIQFSNFLPEICTDMVSRHAKSQLREAQCLLMAVVNEVILGIGHILELEYRVLENDLQSLWNLILFAATLQSTLVKKQGKATDDTETAANLASNVMKIFGELRQVDCPIFSLCKFLRQFMILEHAPSTYFQVKLQSKALVSIYLSPKVLMTLAAVMKEVPEGQLASFMRLLKSDMEETLQLVQPVILLHTVQHNQMQQAAMKVLTEIYICLLEHENVTSSNSIQVGISLRVLMDEIIRPSLGYVVDSIASGGNVLVNFVGLWLANMENTTVNTNKCSLADAEVHLHEARSDAPPTNITIILLCWELFFRLYMSVKMLHRQCITLMPQKMARKSCIAINDPTMLFFMGELTHEDYCVCKEGFFSCIEKGAVSILKFLCGIEEWLQETGHTKKNTESFQYTLDCIAVHSLSDLRRQIKAVNFLLSQTDLAGLKCFQTNQFNEDTDLAGLKCFQTNQFNKDTEDQLALEVVRRDALKAERKNLQKIQKKLRRKAFSLAFFLTRWIRSLSFDSKGFKDRKLGLRMGEALNRSWNNVTCSLNRQILPVARWGLLSQNIDVWPEFASENDLTAFCQFMFRKTLLLKDEQTHDQNFGCHAHSVTSQLLECDLFYEQEAIRGVFLQSLCQEVVQSLSLFEVNITVNSSVKYIERQVGNAQDFASKESENHIKNQFVFEELEESASNLLDVESRELAKCALMINLVSRAPMGYIEASSAATFINFILKLESCIVVWLLTSRKQLWSASKACSTFESSKVLGALELLLACRRSIESLLLQEGLFDYTLEGSYIITALLRDAWSMYWPVLSMHAVATCVNDFLYGQSDDAVLAAGKELLFSYLRCTTGLFTFFSQRIFRDILSPLLRSENVQSSSLYRIGLDDSLLLLLTTLSAQLKSCSQFMKVAVCDFSEGLTTRETMEEPPKRKESTSQECPFGVFAVLGAVSSLLWSITTTLELLDEKCHLDKDGRTNWSGELPDELLSWIEIVETFVIDSMHNVLSADGLAREETIRVENSTDINEVLVLQEEDYGYKKVNSSLQNSQNHSRSLPSDVNMEAFEGLANHEAQESGGDDHDVGANDDSDAEETIERDSCMVKNSCIEKAPEKGSVIWKPSARNVEEGKHTSTQVFGDFSQMSDVQVSMVKDMLLGKLDTISWWIGELFMAMAAILKLKSLFHSPNVINPVVGEIINQQWSSSMGLHVGAANTILKEVAEMPQLKGSSLLILLPGVIKYLESFGSFLPYTRPTLSPAAFVKLVNTQMVLLGAVLSNTQLMESLGSSGEFKLCLQSCFKMFMKNPLGLHFHSALQTIERSLLGFQGSEKRICFGSMKLNSSIFGGIECLLIVLDAVSGIKRLQILSRYSSRYLAAVFSLIINSQLVWHKLSQPKDAFYSASSSIAHDTAFAIWKCVEILVAVSSREVIFPMKANHVAQAMSCPADLFKPFYQRNLLKEKFMQNIFAVSERFDLIEYKALILEDLLLLSEIYIACCKLLRNLLRHRKRESGHCVALLGESLRALLFFLEVMELTTSSRLNIEGKSMQYTIQCASWLRRVYEEIGEHRETLGSYIGHMLSDYICIISGYGISATGLSREVEAIVRPGAYALVDMCSTDDLQQLHAVLGEGPRRTALTALRHDFDQYFKYTGKV